MKHNVFQEATVQKILKRIHQLTPSSTPKWGKMNVSQMLAHCNVTYEMVYDNTHPKPNAFLKFILKRLVKNKVVSDKPFSKNSKTAPQFVITDVKDFYKEKERLLNYISKTKQLGEKHFDGKESHSFGKLTISE